MLVVKEPFSVGGKSYAKGQEITDLAEAGAALAAAPGSVVQTAVVPPLKPQPVAEVQPAKDEPLPALDTVAEQVGTAAPAKKKP